MPQAFIGLGSNVGDREAALQAAVLALSETPGVSLRRLSTFINTAPVGGPPQPDFLNAVAWITTSLAPRALLRRLFAIEEKLGRVRTEKWGPRTLDLDLLLYGREIIAAPGLVVPHPLMHTRAFVLKPLVEIAPGARHPGLKKTARQLLAALERREP